MSNYSSSGKLGQFRCATTHEVSTKLFHRKHKLQAVVEFVHTIVLAPRKSWTDNFFALVVTAGGTFSYSEGSGCRYKYTHRHIYIIERDEDIDREGRRERKREREREREGEDTHIYMYS